jgi:homocitrate synthase NifV
VPNLRDRRRPAAGSCPVSYSPPCRTYRDCDPKKVGREHRLTLGKHSGSRSVMPAYEDLGITLTDLQARDILVRIRDHAVSNKKAPGSEELRRLHLEATAPGALRS